MGYSYKTYSEKKELLKKYVNASEGAIIYSIGKTRFMKLAEEAGAIYKVGSSALVNMQLFEEYLEKYREASRPLLKQEWKQIKDEIKSKSGEKLNK